jgi:hypothetical protein
MPSGASLFEQAVRLTWLHGIHAVSLTPSIDLRNWLMHSTYSFQVAPTPKTFQVFVPDPSSLVEAYAFDANRMASSAFESVASIAAIQTMRRSLAWLAIKCYYAAFYAAHAFTRFQGTSCTQLDNRETSRLAAVSQAYGFTPKATISSGFYTITFGTASNTLVFENSGVTGGGSHETLWMDFANSLTRLKDRISSSTLLSGDKGSLIKKIDQAKQILYSGGSKNANWLSKIRNNI